MERIVSPLSMHTIPVLYRPSLNIAAETDTLSEEDRRKAEKKAKKLEAKAKAAAEEAKKLLTKGNQKKDDNEEEIIKDVDQDVNGERLWQTKSPLQDVEPFVTQLELLGQDNIEALELVCRAAIKRGEYPDPRPYQTNLTRTVSSGESVRALRVLKRMQEIGSQSPNLHLQLVEFALLLKSPRSSVPEAVQALLLEELEPILPIASVSLEHFNTQYLQQHPGDAEAALAAAKAQWTLSEHRDKDGVSSMLLEAFKGAIQPTLAVSSKLSCILEILH